MQQEEVPIRTIHLFKPLDDHLMTLLQSLDRDDWQRQTLAPAWKIKDVVAHMLDGTIRNLSCSRDHYFGEAQITFEGYAGLVQYLNTLNHDWVKAMKRVSPAMLMELLSFTNELYRTHLFELDPFGKAIFSVAWAGETESQNWFHIAREYTEKWHHQQQIREAVDRPSPLFNEELFKPYLSTSFQALPFHFREVTAKEGDSISIIIHGTGSWEWNLAYDNRHWTLHEGVTSTPMTEIELDGHLVWRLFSKQIPRDELKEHMIVRGKYEIAEVFLGMSAAMV